MNYKNSLRLIIVACACIIFTASCVKEGPMGPTGLSGEKGIDGIDGKDANETCKLCHNPSIVDQKVVEFKFSKHHYGEAAFEESGRTGCAPCHTQEGFKDVVKRNVSTVYVKNPSTGKYSNPYASADDLSYGEFSCFTCHTNLHTTYNYTDFYPLATTAAVPLSMWGGAKTVDLKQDGGKSNLCVKCHQPRPISTSSSTSDGNVLDYASLASKPNDIIYDPAVKTNKITPSYRTHVHYGSVGAIYAGTGGVEFSGSLGYTNSIHRDKASCSNCHMAHITGTSGGHTFFTRGNFNGCNVTDCHGANPISSSNDWYWKNPRAEIKKLLDDLAAKLTVNGLEIMNKNPDSEHNLWAGITTANYDGYLNVYDPINNPEGIHNNGNSFQNPNPSSSWTQEMKDINASLPKIKITNAQMGAIINFQMCLREYSLGIHNFKYSKALLTNTLSALK